MYIYSIDGETIEQYVSENMKETDTFDAFATLNAISANCLMLYFVKFVFDKDFHTTSGNVLSSIPCLRLMTPR